MSSYTNLYGPAYVDYSGKYVIAYSNRIDNEEWYVYLFSSDYPAPYNHLERKVLDIPSLNDMGVNISLVVMYDNRLGDYFFNNPSKEQQIYTTIQQHAIAYYSDVYHSVRPILRPSQYRFDPFPSDDADDTSDIVVDNDVFNESVTHVYITPKTPSVDCSNMTLSQLFQMLPASSDLISSISNIPVVGDALLVVGSSIASVLDEIVGLFSDVPLGTLLCELSSNVNDEYADIIKWARSFLDDSKSFVKTLFTDVGYAVELFIAVTGVALVVLLFVLIKNRGAITSAATSIVETGAKAAPLLLI